MAWVSEPTVMSSGRSGCMVFSLMISEPAFHFEWRSLSPGSGPRSRSSTTPESGTRASAPKSVVRTSFRRPNCDSLVPAAKSARTWALTSGAAWIGWRSSTISSSDISVRAQWTAPAPMQNRARPSVRPRAKFSPLM